MSNWLEMLASVDDDYLIGLSNKGIVKRAYKDREQTTCQVVELLENQAKVSVGEETCNICLPLGESSCSCLSRSICKHIVLAILTVQNHCALNREVNEHLPEENEAVKENKVIIQNKAAKEQEITKEQEAAKEQEIIKEQEAAKKQEEIKGHSHKDINNDKNIVSAFPQINTFPISRLIKTLGSRKYQIFINKVKSGWKPDIEITSIITVKFPDTAMTVKLLEPVEYSTCSCHKKELCEHKAEAILWYQQQLGFLKEEELTKNQAESQDMDLKQINDTAVQMMEFITGQLAQGLSRSSQDVVDSMERMAIISHNQGLAECERQFRALGESYQQYFKRMAKFREEVFMEQMMRLYHRVSLLSRADNVQKALSLAGEFKSEYQPVGELYLIGIGARYFKSKSGYEGETFYFLEEKSQKWYTYTNARPVFYENSSRRRPVQKSQVPWNLTMDIHELPTHKLHLLMAKANKKRRLSSSQETKAELIGKRTLQWDVVKQWYYRDFALLFQEQIKNVSPRWLIGVEGEEYGFDDSQSLVFVQAETAKEAVFDTINQIFRLPLLDEADRMITVEVAYSKEEAFTIRYLERIARRMQTNSKRPPCFVGSVYLKDGEIKMYPITCLEEKELAGVQLGEENQGEESIKKSGGDMAAKAAKASIDEPGQKGSDDDGKVNQIKIRMTEEPKLPDKYEVMENMRNQAVQLLTELFQSGFDTVHDSTLEEMQKFSVQVKQHGLHYLSGQTEELVNQLNSQRHQMKHQYEKQAELFETIIQYLFFFREELEKDRAGKAYTAGNQSMKGDRCGKKV